MPLSFDSVYYEPQALEYPLGQFLQKKYNRLPWIKIENHNNIPQLRSCSNRDFIRLKRHLIIGIRKTHRYTENHKVSDFLVPYTSSGCSAMCLYCYLVCNYNKCSYLRVFVNRGEMMEKMIKTANASPGAHTFEIGSNSDLILENTVTNNLPWTIEEFAERADGRLTFPTKFHMVEPLLGLNHQRKTIFRMSVNPQKIIRTVEIGTSCLTDRIKAVNSMREAGYPVGLLIAPVILVSDWKILYEELLSTLKNSLSSAVKESGFLEIIFMTYSFVQNAINSEAFPNAVQLFSSNQMTGRGRGKYRYREELLTQAKEILQETIPKYLPKMEIRYFS